MTQPAPPVRRRLEAALDRSEALALQSAATAPTTSTLILRMVRRDRTLLDLLTAAEAADAVDSATGSEVLSGADDFMKVGVLVATLGTLQVEAARAADFWEALL